jgi:hypothetical protein
MLAALVITGGRRRLGLDYFVRRPLTPRRN